MTEYEILKKTSEKDTKKIIMYSPAQLAYAGDAVYELLVRGHILKNHDLNVNQMHKYKVKFVKAKAQAELVRILENEFTEEEQKIIKRGRNAKVTSSPKNAEIMDYRYATGFEALFGYLYVNGEIDRLVTLFEKIVTIINTSEN